MNGALPRISNAGAVIRSTHDVTTPERLDQDRSAAGTHL